MSAVSEMADCLQRLSALEAKVDALKSSVDGITASLFKFVIVPLLAIVAALTGVNLAL